MGWSLYWPGHGMKQPWRQPTELPEVRVGKPLEVQPVTFFNRLGNPSFTMILVGVKIIFQKVSQHFKNGGNDFQGWWNDFQGYVSLVHKTLVFQTPCEDVSVWGSPNTLWEKVLKGGVWKLLLRRYLEDFGRLGEGGSSFSCFVCVCIYFSANFGTLGFWFHLQTWVSNITTTGCRCRIEIQLDRTNQATTAFCQGIVGCTPTNVPLLEIPI